MYLLIIGSEQRRYFFRDIWSINDGLWIMVLNHSSSFFHEGFVLSLLEDCSSTAWEESISVSERLTG